MKILSLSGGLDSTVLLHKLVKDFGRENIIAVSFNYEQKHAIELLRARLTCTTLQVSHRIIDMKFLADIIAPVSALVTKSALAMPTVKDILADPQPTTYVPFRNMIFLSLCLSVAESNQADEVYIAIQAVDSYCYWDTNTQFVDAVNAVAQLNRKTKVRICSPFANMSKCEEIKLGIELGVPFENTWTCYRGPVWNLKDTSNTPLACGKCPSCAERIQNFAKAGMKDPVEYEIPIDWPALIEKVRV